MSRSNKDELEKLKRNVRNALNRTLTKVKREQSHLMLDKLSLTNKKIAFYTAQKRANATDMTIKLFTIKKHITPTMLPHKESKNGIEVTINKSNKVVITGFGIQKPRRGNGKFLVSSKKNIADGFIVSAGKMPSSYKTKNGIKLSSARDYFTPKRLKDDLADIALGESQKLLKRAEDIFAKELERWNI